MVKRGIVIGAGGSIGKAVVQRMKDRGWSLILLDRDGLDWRDPRTRMIDFSDLYWHEFFEELQGEFDAMVYCAGLNHPMSFDEFSVWAFEELVEANCSKVLRAIRGFCRIARREKSIVVTIGSNTTSIPRSNSFAYGASKSALSGVTLNLARDLAKKKIALVQLDFGIVKDSAMTAEVTKKFKSKWNQMRYRQKWPFDLTARECAEWVAFVAEKGHMATGNCLKIDGAEA